MSQVVIEIPDPLAQRLASLAAEQKKSVEQLVLEHLTSLFEPLRENLKKRYEQFFKESRLFVEVSKEEKSQCQPVSEARLKELAAKLGAAGPLSEVIIEERRGS